LHSVVHLIKSKYKTFIDKNGVIFKYLKTTTVPLQYFKVDRITQVDEGCVLHFKEIDNPILVSCRRAYGINYVGFLITSIGYITYEYSEDDKGSTWRKI
jgi:hypothetical protein